MKKSRIGFGGKTFTCTDFTMEGENLTSDEGWEGIAVTGESFEIKDIVVIGPEHCGLAAEIIGSAILKLQENNIELSTEQLNWLERQKVINGRNNLIKKYCANSGMSEDEFNNDYVALPCSCGEDKCKGWAVVSNNPLSIKAHNDLYNR